MNTKNGGAVIDTCRTFPRTVRDAFPALHKESAIGITGPVVIRTTPPLWVRVLRRADKHLLKWAEFRRVYRLYRKVHGCIYSARIAHGCAFRGLPF